MAWSGCLFGFGWKKLIFVAILALPTDVASRLSRKPVDIKWKGFTWTQFFSLNIFNIKAGSTLSDAFAKSTVPAQTLEASEHREIHILHRRRQSRNTMQLHEIELLLHMRDPRPFKISMLLSTKHIPEKNSRCLATQIIIFHSARHPVTFLSFNTV